MRLADRAIRWYEATARDLPWRHADTSAWGVLVSEIMLQQTPVVRVVPVWSEWLRRWPTPSALAKEPAGEAIRAWGRLGYPRRALRLHECACVLVLRHGGDVPPDLGCLLALPGVGSYTARAVAAFAFRQRHPVVDTNVRRLVARAVAGRAGGGPATSAADLASVSELLPPTPARAARASAAFMELGAMVCTTRNPSCGDCPLRSVCVWQRAGRPGGGALPVRRPQGYVGTDRHVRGLLLALARETRGPVARETLDAAWPDAEQRVRALTGLLHDGLLVEGTPDRYGLPGMRHDSP